MKKTTIAIATMSLILILVSNALGQERRRAPRQVGNPFGLGGTVTAGVKNRKPVNLGDTGTHEVGHKGKRRTQNLLPYMEQDNLKRQPQTQGIMQDYYAHSNVRSTSARKAKGTTGRYENMVVIEYRKQP